MIENQTLEDVSWLGVAIQMLIVEDQRTVRMQLQHIVDGECVQRDAERVALSKAWSYLLALSVVIKRSQ